MIDKLLTVALELAVLSGLAMLYYFWQRHRILKGPRDWPASKLVEAFHLGLNCDEPERYRDLQMFLAETENRLNSEEPWMNKKYIDRWKDAALPEEVKLLLADCSEWLVQSQPKTR
jgi:hypothetical protein